MEVAMGRVQALVLAVALTGSISCTTHSPMILGAPMPPGCAKAALSERCMGWLLDRLLISAMHRPYLDHDVGTYVAEVGRRLVVASGDRRPWTFRVLDDTDVQAFAGLTTTVYINRGALALLRDESELAGVLGHEIAHVLGGHAHEAFEDLAKDLSWARDAADTVRSARDDEIQADETAVTLIAKAGYDAHGVERMMRAYAATSPSDGEDPGDSHPAWVERIARVQALAAAQPAGERYQEAFRERLAQLVVGTDPRNGAIIGDALVFAVADLAVDLPASRKGSSTHADSITVEIDAGNDIDVRVINIQVAPWFSDKPDKDGIVSHVIKRGRVAVAISAKGPLALAAARRMRDTARTPRADELRWVRPKRVDLDAPRVLWLPPP
jgi:predicted Zn-dependent protease